MPRPWYCKDLQIELPDYQKPDGSRASQPFKRSSHDLLRRESLGSHGTGAHPRTDFFKEQLVRIFRQIGGQVPYCFTDSFGRPRSMDAGCLKFVGPDGDNSVEFITSEDGYILAVQPKQKLLEKYPPLKEVPKAAQPATTDDPLGFDPAAPVDDRRKEVSLKVIRDGANQFKRDMLARWGAKCALTGTSVKPALEAAHIHRYGGEKTNDPRNGILLRADVHRLFDRHLLSLRYDGPDLVFAARTSILRDYPSLDGFKITGESLPNPRPHPDVVAQHFREFLEKNKM